MRYLSAIEHPSHPDVVVALKHPKQAAWREPPGDGRLELPAGSMVRSVETGDLWLLKQRMVGRVVGRDVLAVDTGGRPLRFGFNNSLPEPL